MSGAEMTAVRAAASRVLGVPEEEILPSSRFVEDLGADSLDLLHIVMLLEEEFRVPVTAAQLKSLSTVREAAAYLLQIETER